MTIFAVVLSQYHVLQAQQRVMDSLLVIYRQQERMPPDTARVNTLNNLSFAARAVSLNKAEEYANQALTLSRSLQYRIGEGNALRNVAFFHAERGDTAQALTLLQTSYNILEGQRDYIGMAKSLNNKAVILDRSDKNIEAIEVYQRSFRLAQTAADGAMQGAALMNIASIYNEQGAKMRALQTYLHVSRLADSTGDGIGAATALGRIASMYLALDDTTKAMQYYTQALAKHEKMGNKIGMAITLNNLSIMMREQKKFEQAVHYARKSLTLRMEVQDARNTPIAQRSLARSLYGFGQYEEAKQYCFLALKGFETTKNKESFTRTLMDIAEIYRAQDSLQQAIHFVQQADSLIRTQKAVKDLATLSEIYAQGGSVYAQAQRFEEAFAMQKQATLINDSLYRQGRKIDLKQTEERLRLEEYLRQQQQQQEQEQRRIATLQYSGIAVVILILVVVVLFARRLSRYPVLVRWGAFVVALVVFEFLQVLIEPWIQQYIGTTPLEMLTVNVVLAAFFSPVANFAESRLRRLYGTGQHTT